MFDHVLTPADIARRVQLQRLQHSSRTTEHLPHFRVRAWRWHHLGVVRDLSRLERGLSNRSGAMCIESPAAVDTRRQALDALRYILDDNWKLHNFVERALFVPWMSNRKPIDPSLRQHIRLVAAERERLQKEAGGLANQVAKWVNAEPVGCKRELSGITEQVRKLRENATRLFAASEAVFVPRVVDTYSAKEQGKFNDKVLKSITGRQARISLVIFGDAVQQDEPVVATKSDSKDFENDIPAPIRKLAMPYWRNKFVGQRAKFIAGEDSSNR